MQTLPAPAAAATEEFHEAGALWPDCRHFHDDRCRGHQKQLNYRATCGGDARRRPASSAPVAIPVAAARPWCSWARSNDSGFGGDEASFVPPHEVVARRRCAEQRAAASMCVGQGRTLKGRDLRCVRTAVLRMTGFLET